MISVVIPCYNAESWIEDTLNSVFRQGFEPLEVIVIDDGSVDSSADIVAKSFPDVRLVKTVNRGPSAARNLGTEIATGSYIQYLDADDLLAPGKLARQLKLLEETGADVCYGDWQKLQRTDEGLYVEGEVISRTLTNPEIDLFTDFWCPPAVYLFRRKIIDKVGGWREDLPVIQDARFALDCALYGGKFESSDGLMAYYRVHDSDSVSTRDSMAFVRDIFTNSLQVCRWWQNHGGITNERKKALLQSMGYVARASYAKDRKTFQKACDVLESLSPGYVPESPKHLAIASRFLGYPRAEALSVYYRRTKALLSSILS